jgi:hypothetical protein
LTTKNNTAAAVATNAQKRLEVVEHQILPGHRSARHLIDRPGAHPALKLSGVRPDQSSMTDTLPPKDDAPVEDIRALLAPMGRSTVISVVALFAAVALLWAAVHALGDLLGKRAGRAVAAFGALATLVALHAELPRSAGMHWLVQALGIWPAAAVATYLIWSLLGLGPAVYYLRRGPRTARASA